MAEGARMEKRLGLSRVQEEKLRERRKSTENIEKYVLRKRDREEESGEEEEERPFQKSKKTVKSPVRGEEGEGVIWTKC